MIVCRRCIYDETIPGITFDSSSICNYCRQHDALEREYPTGDKGRAILDSLAKEIKASGLNKKYDVVVGVSGGCDSSYLLYYTKSILKLNPLAVHFDNTWNSRIAVENIQRMTGALDIDLYTHVVDNLEYNDIFKSFLKASVPDIDTPADIGLATTHYLAAKKHGIKYIFQGHSFRTEGISPPGWFYMDAKYIETIQRRFGTLKIRTFPNLWLSRWLKWSIIDRIKMIRPLYYIDYDKENVKKFLSSEFGWQWYGGHHMENRTAYFTNNYYLPVKYGIDLRYCEYSALVRSGQLSRERALSIIKEKKTVDPGLIDELQKRLKLSRQEFDDIINLPKNTYLDFKTYKQFFERYRWLFRMMAEARLIPKSFYLKYTRKYSRDDLKSILQNEPDRNIVELKS